MKKNNAIGFSLIALIFICFYLYNAKIIREQQAEQFRLDSLARVEQIRLAAERVLADTVTRTPVNLADSPTGRLVEVQKVSSSVYGNSYLDEATEQEEEFFLLQNDLLKIQFTNQGAKPYSVQLNKYKTHEGEPLMLFDGASNDLSIEFYTNQFLNTSKFFFSQVSQHGDSLLTMRLHIDSLAFVEYRYSLPSNSYMMSFDVRFEGMERYISRKTGLINLRWSIDIPRMEKGYDNEKNFSTMAYKFPGDKKVENLGLRKSEASKTVTTRLEWVAFQQQFFSAIIVADRAFKEGDLKFNFYPQDDPYNRLMFCNADLQIDFEAITSEALPLHFYFGPNHYNTLKNFDREFQEIIPMGGWFIGWINKWFIIPIFNFLNRYISNYGLIILILTIIIKIILYYPNHKSYLSSAKMRVLKPEVQKINEKYPKKEDAMKKQQETMALYKKTGVSMFGGCLPMLFQFPILFAMFRFFPSSIELRQQSFLWATDLSAYDSILNLPFFIPLYGDHVSLFALLMGISMYFYSKINQGQMDTGGQQIAGMNTMMLYFMPIFMVLICNNFSSGLCYYYMLSNFITIFQTWVIRKFFVDDKKILAQLQAKAAASQTSTKPKSKFQQRLDEAYKVQQRRMQEQQKRK